MKSCTDFFDFQTNFFYYKFAKYEEMKWEARIILNVKLDGIYGFRQFDINFTYPKKVANSIIEDECLENRPRFRYKKAIVLMGTNATGKTSLGKALLKIITFLNTGNTSYLFEMLSEDKGSFSIDFVNDHYTLHRVEASIDSSTMKIKLDYYSSEIEMMDSYEMCIKKLCCKTSEAISTPNALSQMIGPINYRFAYPEIETSLNFRSINKKVFSKTFKAILGTLDPTLQNITESKDLKDTFIIRRNNQEIIIQEGKLLNVDVLSSGTAEGIDVAIFLASMMSKDKMFYYCDEHFSYIQSNLEKRIFGLMVERITNNEQLIFTTHNTEMLDLNLPKHSFMFLRRGNKNEDFHVSAISASDILKRNTDSVRCAVENNVFNSIPDDYLLDELELGWEDEK